MVSSHVIKEPGTGRPKGCGIVTFSAAVEVARAITMLHSTDLDGRLISVRKAHAPSIGGRRDEGNGHHDGLGVLVDENTAQYGVLDGIGGERGEHNGELDGFGDYDGTQRGRAGGPTALEGSADHASMVRQVKAWQRKGEGHRKRWRTFVQGCTGLTTYDPSRLDVGILMVFLSRVP